MTAIKMMSGEKFIVSESEAEKVKESIGRAGMIELESGALINLKCIESIAEQPKDWRCAGVESKAVKVKED